MAGQNNANQGSQQQDINQLLKVRREKLANLQEAGMDPFQITKYDVTHHTSDVKEIYTAHEEKLLAGREVPDTEGMDEAQAREVQKQAYEERRSIMDADPIQVTIAGRMMFKRVMGKASFANIQDLKGNIQIYVARDSIGEELYAIFKKSDIGDIWGVKGYAFRTKTGEISIHAGEMTLLSKSLQILPEKFHGLTDTDMRYRQRSLRIRGRRAAGRLRAARDGPPDGQGLRRIPLATEAQPHPQQDGQAPARRRGRGMTGAALRVGFCGARPSSRPRRWRRSWRPATACRWC